LYAKKPQKKQLHDSPFRAAIANAQTVLLKRKYFNLFHESEGHSNTKIFLGEALFGLCDKAVKSMARIDILNL